MHKLIQTEVPRIADVQVLESPFMFIPADGVEITEPRLAFQVAVESREVREDGRVGIHMVTYPCPEEFVEAVPDKTLAFMFFPKKLGAGAWVWEPVVAPMRHTDPDLEA